METNLLKTRIEAAWAEKDFEVFWTQDGSPSLRPFSGTEMMHHRGGAFAETELIYGQVAKQAMDLGLTDILSVGLGAGYNELFIAKVALTYQANLKLNIESFEKDPLLRGEFIDFIQAGKIQNDRQLLYEQILSRWTESERIEVIALLRQMLISENWQIQKEMTDQTNFARSYHVILFDAFSSKESPELWSESFLETFLEKAANTRCIFTTYACTGALKRALKKQGFQLIERPGFHGKRDSIYAQRGLL